MTDHSDFLENATDPVLLRLGYRWVKSGSDVHLVRIGEPSDKSGTCKRRRR